MDVIGMGDDKRDDGIDLGRIAAFVTVARTGSISSAAEACS
jgi:hypothetical protein